MIDTSATVEHNDLMLSDSGRRYGLLRLRIDRQIAVLPGQFAMIKAHGIFEPLLRRAMAYYRSDRDDGGVHVEFIYQVLGRGTQSLAGLRIGDEVDFSAHSETPSISEPRADAQPCLSPAAWDRPLSSCLPRS